jgi:hypothetical protein
MVCARAGPFPLTSAVRTSGTLSTNALSRLKTATAHFIQIFSVLPTEASFYSFIFC